MLPVETMVKTPDRTLGHAKFLGDLCLGISARKTEFDPRNIALRDLCSWVAIPMGHAFWMVARSASALLRHVLVVFQLRSGEKMIRTNARWVVAFVKNIEARRDTAVLDNVGHTVRKDHPGVPCPKIDPSISRFAFSSRPLPAFCSNHRMNRSVLVDLGPETWNSILLYVQQAFHWSSIHTILEAFHAAYAICSGQTPDNCT